jgi:DNA-binding Lrp family transcriptional regulator
LNKVYNTDWKLLNTETGEIKYFKENQVLMNSRSMEAYKQLKEAKRKIALKRRKEVCDKGNFIQVIHRAPIRSDLELSLAESDILQSLFLRVYPRTKNYISMELESDGKITYKKMTQKDISEYIGKSQKQTNRYLKKLVEKNALIQEIDKNNSRNKYYKLNTRHFVMGKQLEGKMPFTKLYQNKLKEVLDKIPKQNHRGGLLKLTKYFHYQAFYLVENPDYNLIIDKTKTLEENLLFEENQGVLKFLSQNQLARRLGIHPQNFIEYIEAYEKAGVLKIEMMGDQYRFIIHPDLMFRSDFKDKVNSGYTNTIKAQFKLLKSSKELKIRREYKNRRKK